MSPAAVADRQRQAQADAFTREVRAAFGKNGQLDAAAMEEVVKTYGGDAASTVRDLNTDGNLKVSGFNPAENNQRIAQLNESLERYPIPVR